jgi:hypothetical protein
MREEVARGEHIVELAESVCDIRGEALVSSLYRRTSLADERQILVESRD